MAKALVGYRVGFLKSFPRLEPAPVAPAPSRCDTDTDMASNSSRAPSIDTVFVPDRRRTKGMVIAATTRPVRSRMGAAMLVTPAMVKESFCA